MLFLRGSKYIIPKMNSVYIFGFYNSKIEGLKDLTLNQNLTILTSFFESKERYHKDTHLKSSLLVLYSSSVSDFLFSSIFIQCHVKHLVKNDIKQIAF